MVLNTIFSTITQLTTVITASREGSEYRFLSYEIKDFSLLNIED